MIEGRRTSTLLFAFVVLATGAILAVSGCGGDGDEGNGDAQADLEDALSNYEGEYTVSCPDSVPTDGSEFTCTVTDPEGTEHEVTGNYSGDVPFFDLNPLGPLTPAQP